MKILFDTNVVLDVLLDREPFSEVAAALFVDVEKNRVTGFFCATTITTIHYLATKTVGNQRAIQEIRKLLSLFDIAAINGIVLERALALSFKDFEGAVLHEAARQVGAQGIVTRNVRDFKRAELPIYTPEELYRVLRG